LTFHVKQFLSARLAFATPAGERGVYHPAGAPVRGRGPSQNRLRDIAQQKPAILFSLHRSILAKGRDRADLAGHREALPVNAHSVAGSTFQMLKRNLISAQVLAEARSCADELTALEVQGPGDLDPAWRRLENRYGIPYSTFWSLKYRPDLKGIWADLHLMLKLAVEHERSRRAAQLSHSNFIEKVVAEER
jgi:hypothetical protein